MLQYKKTCAVQDAQNNDSLSSTSSVGTPHDAVLRILEKQQRRLTKALAENEAAQQAVLDLLVLDSKR